MIASDVFDGLGGLAMLFAFNPANAFDNAFPGTCDVLARHFQTPRQAYMHHDIELNLALSEKMHEASATFDGKSSTEMPACEKIKRWETRPSFLTEPLEAGSIPAAISFSAAVSACEKTGQWEQALLLLEEMASRSLTQAALTFNAGIAACRLGGQWERARLLVGDMLKAFVTPNEVSFNTAMSTCHRSWQWEQALLLFEEMRKAYLTPDMIGFSTAILACERCHRWEQALSWLHDMHHLGIPWLTEYSACDYSWQCEHVLSLLDKMQRADVTPNEISMNAAILACEHCNEWDQAMLLLEEMHKTGMEFDEFVRRRQQIFLSSGRTAHFNGSITVDSANDWNTWAKDFFPNQPALLLSQLDMLDDETNPLLAKFWVAVKTALKEEQERGSECLYRIQDGEIFCRENEDAKEQWYLASDDEDARGETSPETIAGMTSVELPKIRFPRSDSLIRVPAKLLKAYKSEIVDFLLRERIELGAILEQERSEHRHEFTVQWEHRVLRRSFDGEYVKQQNYRFHHDSVPEDIIDEDGVLCSYTVLTVLDNHDPAAEENPKKTSVEQAGTVFKLDTLFGSGRREDPDQVARNPLQRPQKNDGYMYFHAPSSVGITTIFCNHDGSSATDDEITTMQYSWTPQMWHSVAEVLGRNTSSSEGMRSRSVIQTKVIFCGSPASSREDEVANRLKIIGLGPYLNETLTRVEKRFDNGFGPFTFQEFFDFYGDMDVAAAHWYAAIPADANAL